MELEKETDFLCGGLEGRSSRLSSKIEVATVEMDPSEFSDALSDARRSAKSLSPLDEVGDCDSRTSSDLELSRRVRTVTAER